MLRKNQARLEVLAQESHSLRFRRLRAITAIPAIP
jgi:hypothetical protein